MDMPYGVRILQLFRSSTILILILMEDTLRVMKKIILSSIRELVLILILMEDSLWDVNLVFNERIDGLS